MMGMILVAMIVSGAIKERDKEREKQATLRALLEKEGTAVTEVLAYMREKDAAQAAAAAYVFAESAEAMKRWKRRLKVAMGIFAFAAGIYAFRGLALWAFPRLGIPTHSARRDVRDLGAGPACRLAALAFREAEA